MTQARSVPRYFVALCVANVLFALIHIVNFAFRSEGAFLVSLFDLELERNFPTWYSSTLLFVLALLWGCYAYAENKHRSSAAWAPILVALLFCAFSIDEIAMVHERFGWKTDALLAEGTREGTLFRETGIWMFLLGVPFLMGALYLGLALRPRLRGKPKVTALLCTGLVVYLGSAAGLEVLANFVPVEPNNPAHIAQITAEEFGEMMGISIWIWGTAELLRSSGVKLFVAGSASTGNGTGD